MAASISWASRWLKSPDLPVGGRQLIEHPVEALGQPPHLVGRRRPAPGARGRPPRRRAWPGPAPRGAAPPPGRRGSPTSSTSATSCTAPRVERPALRLAQHRLDRRQVPVQQQGGLPGPLQVDRLLQLVGVGARLDPGEAVLGQPVGRAQPPDLRPVPPRARRCSAPSRGPRARRAARCAGCGRAGRCRSTARGPGRGPRRRRRGRTRASAISRTTAEAASRACLPSSRRRA